MAAQPQQNRPQEVIINLKAEVQKLKEMRDAIELMKQEGKLANVNENTYRALFNQIEQTIKRMNEGIRDGAIGASGLKSIQRGFESITSSISKMVSQEKSTGMGLTEYNKKLEEAEKTVRDQIAAIEELKKKQKELSVTEKGNPKRGQEGQIMAAARKASRAERGNKGGDTKAEALLKGGDLKGIQEQAAGGDKHAVKALELYNAELARQTGEWTRLTDEIEQAKEQLNQYKAILSEIKSLGAYNEDAVKEMEEMTNSTEKVGKSLGKVREEMDKTNQTNAKIKDGMEDTSSAAVKAAATFVKFNVVVNTFKKMLREGIKAVVEMDKALTDMSIVTGTSKDKLQSMIPQFNALGRATGVTSTEVAGLTAEYMKQGRAMKDSLELAEQTAKAAKISGISAAESIEYMTSAINGFNLAAKDAEHVSDVFAKLGAASATDYKDLAIALSKVSAQANTAGMSMEFTTTLLAKGLEVTQEAPESIGTALKTVLARMRELSDYGSTLEDNTSVNKVEKALASVGVELRDTNGQFRDMEEIFTELGPKWDSLNTMQQQAIAQAVAGTRQQSRFLAIMQDWDRTIELSNSALEAEGATMYQHAQYAESLEYSINKLQTAWQGLVSSFTNSNLVTGVFSVAADILSGIVDAINFLNDISGGLVGTAFTILVPLTIVIQLVKERLLILKQEKQIREEKLRQIEEEKRRQEEANAAAREGVDIQNQQVGLIDKIKQGWADAKKAVQDYIAELGKIAAANFTNTKKGIEDKREIKNAKKLQAKINKEKQKGEKANTKFIEKNEKKVNKTKLKMRDKEAKAEQARIDLMRKNAEETIKDEGERKKALDQINAEQIKLDEFKKKTADELEITEKGTLAVKQTETVVDTTNAALSEAQAESAEDEAQSTQENLVAETATVVPEGANAVAATVSAEMAEEENKETKKSIPLLLAQFAAKAAGAVATAAGAIAGVATSPFGIAALAVLAAVGIAAAVGGAVAAGRKEDTAENQNKIYENKEKKNNIDSLTGEYEELMNKRVKTDEEMARLEEIESQLHELDEERFKGKSGDELLNAAKEESERLGEENRDLINENWENIKKGAKSRNFWGKSRAKDFLTSDEGKLAMKQLTQQNVDDYVTSNVDEKYQREVSQAAQRMFTTISNEEIEAMLDSGMSADEVTKYLEEFGVKAAKAAENIAVAGDEYKIAAEHARKTGDFEKAKQLENQAFVEELEAYNEQIAAAANDPEMQEALQAQYKGYALLSESMDGVNTALNSGVLSSSMVNLANKFNDLGVGAEGLTQIFKSLAADEYGNISVKAMNDWTDDQWKKLALDSGVTEEDWDKMDEEDKRSFKTKMLDVVMDEAVVGMSRSQVGDVRAGMDSKTQNTADLKTAIMSGEGLSQEDQEYLRDNYSSIYGSKEYQEAMTSGDYSKIVDMIDEADRKTYTEKESGMRTHAQNAIDTFATFTGGLSYEDYMAGNYDASQYSAQQLMEAERIAADIQYYKDSADALADYKYEYEGLTSNAEKFNEAQERYEKIQERIDKKGGYGTVDDYKEMQDALLDSQKIAQDELNASKEKFEKIFGSGTIGKELQKGLAGPLLAINEETGEIQVNMEQYEKLSAAEREQLDAQLEVLKEQNETLAEQKAMQEELYQMQRDQALDMQEQAIAVMQARLDAEYEATQKSLEKRQELYEKYFDALEQEESTEDYENERQALLNKIAALSTATDSESLAKLKEAQEALSELDDEQLQSERDLRREAVEESFEKQGEDLDAAYENAMNNVEGLWQEFVTMQKEDQEALFKQYGEEFQNVTALAAEVAAENLSHFLDAVEGRGITQPDGTVHKYAEGGLVDYTGPAWVDGTKSRPEAFLDAVDTANIANLAQGLRALVSGSIGMGGMQDTSTITINELNINVNGSADGQAIGQDAADGFMKAMRELGININKQG